ncbi:MAG TPA: hypothetical protein VGR27_11200, partial [Longimicrobiaceae bacterium]|nr:hypothetical protein [Longimicrobiaceae bacterium]
GIEEVLEERAEDVGRRLIASDCHGVPPVVSKVTVTVNGIGRTDAASALAYMQRAYRLMQLRARQNDKPVCHFCRFGLHGWHSARPV